MNWPLSTLNFTIYSYTIWHILVYRKKICIFILKTIMEDAMLQTRKNQYISNTIDQLCEGYVIYEETGSEFPLYWIEQLQLLQPGTRYTLNISQSIP